MLTIGPAQLPSAHIYRGFEVLNAKIVRACLDAYAQAPKSGWPRYSHAAYLQITAGFVGGANAPAGYVFQSFLAYQLCVWAGGGAAGMPHSLSACAPYVDVGMFNLLSFGAAALALGIGPQASARRRAAGRVPRAVEQLLEFGCVGFLQCIAAGAARRCAATNRTSAVYAASACELGVACMLEPLRVVLACLGVGIRLGFAASAAALDAAPGVVLALLETGDAAEPIMLHEQHIAIAAALLGCHNPLVNKAAKSTDAADADALVAQASAYYAASPAFYGKRKKDADNRCCSLCWGRRACRFSWRWCLSRLLRRRTTAAARALGG